MLFFFKIAKIYLKKLRLWKIHVFKNVFETFECLHLGTSNLISQKIKTQSGLKATQSLLKTC